MQDKTRIVINFFTAYNVKEKKLKVKRVVGANRVNWACLISVYFPDFQLFLHARNMIIRWLMVADGMIAPHEIPADVAWVKTIIFRFFHRKKLYQNHAIQSIAATVTAPIRYGMGTMPIVVFHKNSPIPCKALMRGVKSEAVNTCLLCISLYNASHYIIFAERCQASQFIL